MTIFDLVLATDIVAYWDALEREREPYLGEELFPSEQKLGLTLEWLKGASGLPIVLKPSAFDAAAIPRPRIGFDKLSAQMPFFKESKYIDEEMRQELNKVIETGNQAYIDTIIDRIFNDELELLEGARSQRERMRMSALTTGVISITGNGQDYDYDYQMPSGNKVDATTAWSNAAATILNDIKTGKEKILSDTGVTVTRAICSSKVFGYIRANTEIKKSMLPLTDGVGYISDAKLKQFLLDELDLQVVTYDKRYKDEAGATKRYVPEDVFVMFPSGALGKTWFGTTPEQSDLMTGAVANVAITDVGVAVTTMKKADPVQVETKVTMICLPSFPTADQCYIIDTTGA